MSALAWPTKPWSVQKGETEGGEPCWYADENDYDDEGRWTGGLGHEFPTHAEAITYAHEQATIQALAAGFTIPPENPVARAMKGPTY